MVLGRLNTAAPVLRVRAVTVVHLDAHLVPHAAPVDVEHVAVSLTDGFLHQVSVSDVDLLLQSLGLPDILWAQTLKVNIKRISV